MHQIEQVSAARWQEWVRSTGGTIIDVREPFEWHATGVLPGSETISLGQLRSVLERFERKTPLLLVCRSGNRSQAAAEFLAGAGFNHVANLRDGIIGVTA